jgi:hypothetical protein
MLSPTKQQTYGSATEKSVLPLISNDKNDEHNEHHLPFILSPSAFPLQLPEKGCAGTSQPPYGWGGGGVW